MSDRDRIEPFALQFADGGTAIAVRVATTAELPIALTALGLVPRKPTVVVIGGAGGLAESDLQRLRSLFTGAIVPVVEDHGGVGVDGGTLSGVMRLFGEARADAGADFPLLGVAAEGTVVFQQGSESGEQAPLEPRHSHFLLVPGQQWGAESPWIAEVATVLAADAPSITLLINGGQIALDDVERSLDAGREVIVIAGSGRSADALAAAVAGNPADEHATRLAKRGGIHIAPVDDSGLLVKVLSAAIGDTRN